MKYQNILQSFLYHRIYGVNLKMEAVSSESQFNKNKHWICHKNLVFIHRTNIISWFYRDNNNNNNNNNKNINNTNSASTSTTIIIILVLVVVVVVGVGVVAVVAVAIVVVKA